MRDITVTSELKSIKIRYYAKLDMHKSRTPKEPESTCIQICLSEAQNEFDGYHAKFNRDYIYTVALYKYIKWLKNKLKGCRK